MAGAGSSGVKEAGGRRQEAGGRRQEQEAGAGGRRQEQEARAATAKRNRGQPQLRYVPAEQVPINEEVRKKKFLLFAVCCLLFAIREEVRD